MSVGAEYYGQNGYTAEQILTHYYTDVFIDKDAWVFKYEYVCIDNNTYRKEWWRRSTTGEETTPQYVLIGSGCIT